MSLDGPFVSSNACISKVCFFSKNVKLLGSNKEGVYIIHLIHVMNYIYYVRLFLKCTDFGDDVMFIIIINLLLFLASY